MPNCQPSSAAEPCSVPRYTAFGGTRHERSWGSPGSVRSHPDTPRYAWHSHLDTARCARHSAEREDGHFRSGSPCPDHPECEAEGLVYRGTRVIVRRSYRGGCELSSNTNAAFPRLRVPRYTAFVGPRPENRWGSPGYVPQR